MIYKKKFVSILLVFFICFISAFSQKIIDAAQQGDFEKVKELLEKNPELLYTQNTNGMHLLHYTAAEGHFDIVKLLVDKGSDVNVGNNSGFTPLHYAAVYIHIEIVRYLIEKGADINAKTQAGFVPMFLVAYTGDTSITELLISHGANINALNNAGTSILDQAVFNCLKDMIDLLLAKGAKVSTKDEKGVELLHAAIDCGHNELIDQLLSKGIKMPEDMDKKNNMLHSAARMGHKELVDILLGKGADIHSKNKKGSTLLHSAASGGLTELIALLIEKGVNVNERNDFSLTPLHKAAISGNLDVIELLISKGANINIKSNGGETPLHIASKNGYGDIVELLIKKEANNTPKKFPDLFGDYLGQKPLGLKPEIFAPEIISVEDLQEFAGTFSPDGKEFFFTRRKTVPDQRVWYTNVENGKWIQPLLSPVTYDCFEYEPHISPDGTKLFYGSRRPKPGKEELNNRSNIWVSVKNKTGWDEPYFLDTIINNVIPMYISATIDGTLYFTNNRDGGIYFSKIINGKYITPERLPDEINYLFAAHPYIAPDESYLIFDARPAENLQYDPDLYISFHKPDGSWTKAVNMGEPVNSGDNEICASVSHDGKYMFFESNRAGSMNIYWVDAKIIKEIKENKLK